MPDLIHGIVDVGGGTITITIQFAPGTLDDQATRLAINLDTDQNASTGIASSALGIDYSLDAWAATGQTIVLLAMPAACTAGGQCYSNTGLASFSLGADRITATVPLTMLGNASGRLNYRVGAYHSVSQLAASAGIDWMPDIDLPPAHVP